MLQILLIAALGALPQLARCTATAEPDRPVTASRPLVPQRVLAAVRREASQLVRLETEHEVFLTTPEHPFATPGTGWTRAARLVPGDWVVSARFGAVRLSSVRHEPAPRPVPVFNLTVAASHAYFIGTDRLLVHNTKCSRTSSEVREAAIEQALRERDEINRELEALTQTAPRSPQIAVLKTQRVKLRHKIHGLRRRQRESQGVVPLSRATRIRQHFEADQEAARKALEDAENELAALESRSPGPEAAALAARRAELEKQIPALGLSAGRATQILTWLGELEQLGKDTPATDADRQALEGRKNQLRGLLRREQSRASSLKYARKYRAGPGQQERAAYDRKLKRRLLRLPAHLADTERARDPLELLEGALARLLQAPPSESRDARVRHLTEHLEATKQLAEIRRVRHAQTEVRRRARRAREELVAKGNDTSEIDGKIERIEQKLRALRIELVNLRARERLLAQLSHTPWVDELESVAPDSVDEARLREIELQLAGGLESEQQLVDFERTLDAMEPTHAHALRDEAHDVDDILSELEEQMQQSPSPERAAGLRSSSERLQQELREERTALDVALSALANEYAHIHTTQAASSSGPSWQERLSAIQEEQRELHARWRAGLQVRLDRARQELHLLLSIERFRDDQVEAELTREIALLEHELQSSGW